MRNIVDVSAFTDPITLPENGEPVAAEVRDASFQGLANRTRNLKNRADGHDTDLAALETYLGTGDATRTVRVGAFRGADPEGAGSWLTSNPILLANQAGRAAWAWDVSAGVELPWKGSVTQVQVQVKPGGVRGAPADQMRASLYRIEADPSVIVQVGSTVLAANSATLQLITLPGTTAINGEATGGNNVRLYVVVETGTDAGATLDEIYECRFTTTTTVR